MRVTTLQSILLPDLEPILSEELACWRSQLHWDFAPALQLIRKHVSVHALSGCALQDSNGTTIGYGFYLIEGAVGYIGNVFIRSRDAGESAYSLLIEALLGSLNRHRHLRRIEGQIFPFNFEFAAILQGVGVDLMERRYLERSLQNRPAVQQPPNGFRLERWNQRLVDETARTIFLSYQGSPDWNLCADYQSVRGCRRFITNLVIGPGCGAFLAAGSLAIFDSNSELVAVLLSTQISDDTVMIPQISVHPAFQRQGLGSFLLEQFLAKNSPSSRASLSVSCQNEGALRLYERFGFRTVKNFYGMVLEKVAAKSR